jgi:hypothetical protein
MMTKDTIKYWTENNVCMNSDLPLDWCTQDVAGRTKKTFNQKKKSSEDYYILKELKEI